MDRGAASSGGAVLTRRWLIRLGQLTLTVVVTWFILDRVGLGLDELRGVDPALWLPAPLSLLSASLLLLSAYVVSAALWGRIVHDLGGPRLHTSDAVQLFMIANLGRYVPGKVWQIAGLAALGRTRGVPPGVGTAAAVLGQGIALVAASAIGAVALLGAPAPYRRWAVPVLVVLGVLILLLAVPVAFRTLARGWFRLTRTEAPDSLEAAHGGRWLAAYAVNWAMYATAFWLLAAGIVAEAPFVSVATAFAAAYVLGYVMIFAPAGLGPREGFLIALLTPSFGAGPAGVVAVVARLWTTLVEIVPAGIFWARFVAKSREASEEQGSA